ncbi:MAG: hypothetical protein ABSB18_02750 [Candidatus Omnitrophota bacterium]
MLISIIEQIATQIHDKILIRGIISAENIPCPIPFKKIILKHIGGCFQQAVAMVKKPMNMVALRNIFLRNKIPMPQMSIANLKAMEKRYLIKIRFGGEGRKLS